MRESRDGELLPLDWFWVGAFLLLMVGGAAFFYRLARRSESDFFLAGRGLPWWLPASSVFSTHTATDTPMWVTGVIYGSRSSRALVHVLHGLDGGRRIRLRTHLPTLVGLHPGGMAVVALLGGLGAELLRGWLAGWQFFMNMFILGWVGIAMGKVCALVVRMARLGRSRRCPR